jgi:hypothetical protein
MVLVQGLEIGPRTPANTIGLRGSNCGGGIQRMTKKDSEAFAKAIAEVCKKSRGENRLSGEYFWLLVAKIKCIFAKDNPDFNGFDFDQEVDRKRLE